jgi:CRISPR/Cas system Type II protein with McrA/HNH and RuvC-like nuclease domain
MEYSPRLISEALQLSSDVLVFKILKNRTYIGEITFQGKQYTGLHQRIIEDDVFFKAQDILDSRSVTRQASNYLLSSIVYCGDCHTKMRYMKWG